MPECRCLARLRRGGLGASEPRARLIQLRLFLVNVAVVDVLLAGAWAQRESRATGLEND